MIDLTQRWQVIEGDCLQVLRELPDGCVDAVVTDPPYGVGLGYSSFVDSRDNVMALLAEAMPSVRRVAPVVALTPGNGNQDLYPKPDWTFGWFFSSGTNLVSWGFQNWQPVLVWGDGDPYLKECRGARPDAFWKSEAMQAVDHPCPKPIGFMRWLVERVTTKEDKIVLDPFCGSGTTGVACMQTGRRFIGIEIDPGYCAIARRRIAEAANTLWTPEPVKVETQELFVPSNAGVALGMPGAEQ